MKLQLKLNAKEKGKQTGWSELNLLASDPKWDTAILSTVEINKVYIQSYCSQSGYDWCACLFHFQFWCFERICVGFLLNIDPIRLLNKIRQKRIQLAAHASTLCRILIAVSCSTKLNEKLCKMYENRLKLYVIMVGVCVCDCNIAWTRACGLGEKHRST